MLKEANFPHLTDPDAAPKRTGSFLNLKFESEKHGRSDNESATMTSEDILSPYTSDDDDDDEEEHDENASPPVNGRSAAKDNRVEKEIKQQQPKTQPQRGVIETKSECESAEEENNIKNKPPQDEPGKGKPPKRDNQNNPYGDEDTFFVRIPVPGLPLGGSCLLDPTRLHRHEDNWKRDMRLAPGLCTICLSNYKVGTVHNVLQDEFCHSASIYSLFPEATIDRTGNSKLSFSLLRLGRILCGRRMRHVIITFIPAALKSGS